LVLRDLKTRYVRTHCAASVDFGLLLVTLTNLRGSLATKKKAARNAASSPPIARSGFELSISLDTKATGSGTWAPIRLN
jgi:hypothetical protein